MSVEIFMATVCLIGTVVCYIGYRLGTENTYLKYKEQRVGGKKI